ncbi:MAG: hypothetical protein IJN75_04300 [Clostridia bacterium]|nr:hypothetical protein [Clostridia bacterium]
MTHTIKTATACYTGGGIYIYYGQLASGLYFRTDDESETIYICNADTSTEQADYSEFYEQHTAEELNGENFKAFWNQMLFHVLNGGRAFDKWGNYSKSDLENRIIK